MTAPTRTRAGMTASEQPAASRSKRGVLLFVAPFIALGLVSAVISRTSNPVPSGPNGSSYATASGGVAAWSTLLERSGVPVVQRRVPLDEGRTGAAASLAPLDPRATLVVLDQPLSEDEIAALRTFLDRGGRLVAGGPQSSDWIGRVADVEPAGSFESFGVDRAISVEAPVAWGNATTLAGSGTGSWRIFDDVSSGTVVVARSGDEPVVVQTDNVVALSDQTVVDNEHLARRDNAGFALALAGGRTVHFAEAGHGYRVGEIGKGLPRGGSTALWILIGALILFLLSRMRRNGPPEQPSRDLPPPTRAYIEALAIGLASTKSEPPPNTQRVQQATNSTSHSEVSR